LLGRAISIRRLLQVDFRHRAAWTKCNGRRLVASTYKTLKQRMLMHNKHRRASETCLIEKAT
jgi:hypothetical protein